MRRVEQHPELPYWLALRRAGLGSTNFALLLARFGTIENAWRAPAEQLASAGGVLAYRAWQMIAASQQRLVRPHISGGAADPVNEKIRTALVAKTLPAIGARAWVGKAQGGHRCACCAALIAAGEPEYEPRDQTGLYAHIGCFTAWRDQSSLLKQEPGASAAGG